MQGYYDGAAFEVGRHHVEEVLLRAEPILPHPHQVRTHARTHARMHGWFDLVGDEDVGSAVAEGQQRFQQRTVQRWVLPHVRCVCLRT